MEANRRPLTSRNYQWVQALARWLAARGVSPNGISIAGMVFATLGAASFYLQGQAYEIHLEMSHGAILGLAPDAATLYHFRWMHFSSLIGAAVCIQLRLMCNLLDGL